MEQNEWVPLAGTRRIARLSRSVSNGFLDLLLVPLQLIGFAFSNAGEASVNFGSGRLRFGRHEIISRGMRRTDSSSSPSPRHGMHTPEATRRLRHPEPGAPRGSCAGSHAPTPDPEKNSPGGVVPQVQDTST